MRRSGPFPSVCLAALLTIAAGLPGFEPLLKSDAQQLRLFAMTELAAESSGHYVVMADINNRAVEVLVDTGASAVALSFEDAEKIGLRPKTLNYDVNVQTANGMGKAARVTLQEVEINNIRVSSVEGLVLQRGALKGTLLGMSFLSRLRSFTIENGKLILKN
jgi:aspartyl protease family protein